MVPDHVEAEMKKILALSIALILVARLISQNRPEMFSNYFLLINLVRKIELCPFLVALINQGPVEAEALSRKYPYRPAKQALKHLRFLSLTAHFLRSSER